MFHTGIAVLLGAACMAGTSTAVALTAPNPIQAGQAGHGTGAVSGYAVSGIGYRLAASDAAAVDRVTFQLSPASSAEVRVAAAGRSYSCVNTAGSVTCDLSAHPAPVSAIDELEVTAVQ